MEFPEVVEDEKSMVRLIDQVRVVGLREMLLGGSKLVTILSDAVWVSFHDAGKAIMRYKRRGDGTWHRVSDSATDDTSS